jgi:hypothetical protein
MTVGFVKDFKFAPKKNPMPAGAGEPKETSKFLKKLPPKTVKAKAPNKGNV